MKVIVIQGVSNSGKTGICNELIGIRTTFFRIPRKYKNQIAAVYLGDSNTPYPNLVLNPTIPQIGRFCLVVSEGDSIGCIDNIFSTYTDPKGGIHGSYIDQCNSVPGNPQIDYLIVTVRSTQNNLILKALTTHCKTLGISITGTVTTNILTANTASLSTYYISKSIDVLKYIV